MPHRHQVAMARCFDCLTEDVTVKVIDGNGHEHWYCAADWEANQQFHDALMKKLSDAVADFQTQA